MSSQNDISVTIGGDFCPCGRMEADLRRGALGVAGALATGGLNSPVFAAPAEETPEQKAAKEKAARDAAAKAKAKNKKGRPGRSSRSSFGGACPITTPGIRSPRQAMISWVSSTRSSPPA